VVSKDAQHNWEKEGHALSFTFPPCPGREARFETTGHHKKGAKSRWRLGGEEEEGYKKKRVDGASKKWFDKKNLTGKGGGE